MKNLLKCKKHLKRDSKVLKFIFIFWGIVLILLLNALIFHLSKNISKILFFISIFLTICILYFFIKYSLIYIKYSFIIKKYKKDKK